MTNPLVSRSSKDDRKKRKIAIKENMVTPPRDKT